MRSILLVSIDEHLFALPTIEVLRVVNAVAVIAVPQAPAVVQGLMNLHGQIVPVLDGAACFGFAPRPLTSGHHFVILSARAGMLAIVVDAVQGVVEVAPQDFIFSGSGLAIPAQMQELAQQSPQAVPTAVRTGETVAFFCNAERIVATVPPAVWASLVKDQEVALT